MHRLRALVVERGSQRAAPPAEAVASAAALLAVEPLPLHDQRHLPRRELLHVVAGQAGGLGQVAVEQRVVPGDVHAHRVVEGGGGPLALMTDRAAEAIDGVVPQDVAGVDRVRKRHVGHPRVVDATVAGDAAIHGVELRHADLLQLDAEVAGDGAPAVVGGLRRQNRLVLLLRPVPLGQEVLPHRGGDRVPRRQEARAQQDPAVCSRGIVHGCLSERAIARATSRRSSSDRDAPSRSRSAR